MSYSQVGPVLDPVRAMIARVLNIPSESVGVEVKLAELGLDSLGRMELALRLERAFGHEIPDDVVDGSRSVAEVVCYLGRRLPEVGQAA